MILRVVVVLLCTALGDAGLNFGGFFPSSNQPSLGLFNPLGALSHAGTVLTGVSSVDKSKTDQPKAQEGVTYVPENGERAESTPESSTATFEVMDSSTAVPPNSTVTEPSSTKKPHVPVDDEDRRVVVEAPQKSCGDNSQRDHSGMCRETFRSVQLSFLLRQEIIQSKSFYFESGAL
jgi:hypothetical protein